MPLYQFVLEIYHGVNHYQDKQFVLAADGGSAVRFAREFADTWRPNARHDHELDLYSSAEGWPQWTLAQCAVVIQLTVSISGKRQSAQVAVVPWQNSFADLLDVATKLLGALCVPSLADCSLKWITQDHLDLSERAITQAHKAVIDLRGRVAGCAAMLAGESEIAQWS